MVDENGVMTDNFTVGEEDHSGPDPVEDLLSWKNDSRGGEIMKGSKKVERYEVCDVGMVDYIPCLDNVEAIEGLEKKGNGSVRGERYERHCPEEGKGLNCVVPAPRGYRSPILWPQSRDEVLFGFGLCKFHFVIVNYTVKIFISFPFFNYYGILFLGW